MDNSNNWTEEDIQKYIDDEIDEHQTLEFKSAGAFIKSPPDIRKKKIDEITKDVSAMANADGGILIYGIHEHQDPKRKSTAGYIDWIDRSEFSPEWLQQIINQIRPELKVKIHVVKNGSDPNKVVYVVDIPKATTAHQSNHHVYYKRVNTCTNKMEHYEIEDVMNRSQGIDIDIYFYFEPFDNYYRLISVIENTGSVLINRLKIRTYFPKLIEIRKYSNSGLLNDFPSPFTDMNVYVMKVKNAGEAIFPEDQTVIRNGLNFSPNDLRDFGDNLKHIYIYWKIFADDMKPKSGSFKLLDLLEDSRIYTNYL